MKIKTITILAMVIFTSQSCINSKSSDGLDGNKSGLVSNIFGNTGKGEIIEKKHQYDFEGIEVSTGLKAEVYKSNNEEIIVSAPSDLMEFVEIIKNGGKVNIRINNNGMRSISTDRISIKIFANDFNYLSASSSGDIILKDDFKMSNLDVKVSSSGSIKGNINAESINITTSSSGDLEGEIMTNLLKISSTSSSEVNTKGIVKEAMIEASSSADINAGNLIIDKAKLSASSSADITVAVRNKLTASASSSADITVIKKGNLNDISINESSSGSITIN